MKKILVVVSFFFIICSVFIYLFLLDKPFTPIQKNLGYRQPIVEIIFFKSDNESDVFHIFVENATEKDVVFSNSYKSNTFSHCYGGKNISCYLLKEPQTVMVKGFKITFNKTNYSINNIDNKNPDYSSSVIRSNNNIDWGGQIIYWEKPFGEKAF
jgi:hypothetical protein